MTVLMILLALTACDDKAGDPGPGGIDDTGDPVADDTGEVIDADGDGSPASEDCDDSDPAVNADAEEICDGVDNDCDGTIDQDAVDAGTWYPDVDEDGFGDSTSPTTACEAPDGSIADGQDCDDSSAAVNPDATEVCNDIDDDCDGLIDDEDDSLDSSTASTWYADTDSDGYGDPANETIACDAPSGTVADATDCDDDEIGTNPGASETWYDGVDSDCDGAGDYDADGDGQDASDQGGEDCDDGDATVNTSATETWYDGVDSDCDGASDYDADGDGEDSDGYGGDDCDDDDAAVNTSATDTWYDGVDSDCDGASDYDADGDGEDSDGYGGDDCDDDDAGINTSATETWYDGVDSDCDGASDYDADGDGDDAEDYGGDDCDDTDATRYGGVDCRPAVSCTHPDAATLASYDPSAGSDLVFDDDCNALVGTIISGADYVYAVDSTGAQTVYYGYSNYDINSVAIDPADGSIVVGYTSDQAVGYQNGSSLDVIADSGTGYVLFNDGPWSNAYMDMAPNALAVDSAGCIWVPNWVSAGELACVLSDGTVSTLSVSSDPLLSLALDSVEGVYVAIDDTIYEVDTSSGSTTSMYVATDTILDFTFDYNDDIYVETIDDVITWVSADLGTESTYASVTGDAKLAISPDGWLVRLIGNPTSAATYEEWELGD